MQRRVLTLGRAHKQRSYLAAPHPPPLSHCCRATVAKDSYYYIVVSGAKPNGSSPFQLNVTNTAPPTWVPCMLASMHSMQGAVY